MSLRDGRAIPALGHRPGGLSPRPAARRILAIRLGRHGETNTDGCANNRNLRVGHIPSDYF